MAKTEWRVCKLDDLGFVGRGKSRHRPRNEVSLYGGKYPFFQTGDIKATDFHLTEYSQTYSEKGLAQSKLWQPGTLCITIAANIAETAILGIPGCFPDSVVGFVADPEKADVRFVKYFIDTLKLQMQSVSRGTTQDNLSVDKLLKFDFRVPSLSVQRRIATILSAYDDLIENNGRRIKILEEMAQNLYREWFVNFRYPLLRSDGSYTGQADPKKIKTVDSPLGKIPEGWEVGKLGDVCSIQKSRYDENRHGTLPLVDLSRMPSHTLAVRETGTPQELTTSRIIFDEDDILFGAIRPYLHKVVLAPCSGVTNVSVFVLRASTPTRAAFLAVVASSVDTVRWADKHSTGTKMPVIQWELLSRMPVMMPDAVLLDRFHSCAAPILSLVKRLAIRNALLRQTRDLLLPRLISGEVDVANLDIKIPELK